ncbi:L,D-transpeptidase family protein [Sediminibacterium soli]|uniref:L,D-transpeptidase family protein n=1 Tax=Sediminibacterium soli TaxID=2698829 RepID=UPI00137B4AE0|nr:L,D-transpeptidase family protein [Sediminibacterium soli]NCI47827.1 L,D-transpeptidase family protein [Sediminibacterium soli]
MTKKIVFAALLALLVCTSCKTRTRRIWQRIINSEKVEEDIYARDYSITKENAYNDIFLDSLGFEKFIAAKALNDSVSSNMRDFYNMRNFEYAWFDSKGLTEQALGFRSLFKYKTDSVNKKLDQQLDNLIRHDQKIDPADPAIIAIELQLSKRFVQFILDSYKDDNIELRNLESFIPIKKQNPLDLADSLLSRKSEDAEKFAKISPAYNGLREQLKKYAPIARKGNWDTIPVSKTKYALGKKFPEIPYIKSRLAVTGELETADTSRLFTPELEEAVKKYQATHGMTPDGKIGPLVIRSLNVSALDRVKQLLVNMERMRWMPTRKEGKLLTVNIPEFTLHVTEGENHVRHMPVVVGKEGHTTVMFSDDLEYVVFSPYWNIPPSIVRNEILPALSRNGAYLEQNDMEIVSKGGGTPEMRQRPGPKNSLGLVKFLFPNSFNIYFHDTPAKSLFEKDNRAFSHGCIRLGDPVWMANYLLQDSPEWTPEKIDEAMHAGVEKTVKLKNAVPVIITYYTAWIDENNQLQFRDDIYGNDKNVAQKMFL